MAITYSTTLKNARLDAITTAIGTAAKLEIGSTGMGTVLATVALANPAAPAAVNGILSFTMPKSDTSADASGTAAEARIRTGADIDVITGLTVGISGQNIVLNSVTITAGQTVIVNSATIIHA